MREPLGQWLRHVDEVAGKPGFGVGGERLGSCFDVAEPLVERRKLAANIDDAYVHEAAPRRPSVVFDGSNHCFANPLFLSGRIDREQAEIGSVVAKFDVNAGGHVSGFFRDQKLTRFHQSGDFGGVGAVAVDEKRLRDAERIVDDADDGIDVRRVSRASIHGSRDSGHFMAAQDCTGQESLFACTGARDVGRVCLLVVGRSR